MWRCPKFPTLDMRISQCVSLKLCELCTSNKHTKDQCPGIRDSLNFKCFVCKTKKHISAMCPNRNSPPSTSSYVCINHADGADNKQILLPTLTISLKNCNLSRNVRCLIDSGSMRSYFSSNLMNELKVEKSRKVNFFIRAYLSGAPKLLDESVIDLTVLGEDFTLPLFFDPDCAIEMTLENLGLAVENISREHDLADFSFSVDSDVIKLDGLIGADILQFFPDFESRRLLNAKALIIHGKVIPFGNIEGFLTPQQVTNSIKNSSVETQINFVTNPKNTYFDPFSNVFTDSNVEHGVENLFNLESIGIKEDSNFSSSVLYIHYIVLR